MVCGPEIPTLPPPFYLSSRYSKDSAIKVNNRSSWGKGCLIFWKVHTVTDPSPGKILWTVLSRGSAHIKNLGIVTHSSLRAKFYLLSPWLNSFGDLFNQSWKPFMFQFINLFGIVFVFVNSYKLALIITIELHTNDWPFDPNEWLASYFSLQHHSWIKH